jgi:hypothetical protein
VQPDHIGALTPTLLVCCACAYAGNEEDSKSLRCADSIPRVSASTDITSICMIIGTNALARLCISLCFWQTCDPFGGEWSLFEDFKHRESLSVNVMFRSCVNAVSMPLRLPGSLRRDNDILERRMPVQLSTVCTETYPRGPIDLRSPTATSAVSSHYPPLRVAVCQGINVSQGCLPLPVCPLPAPVVHPSFDILNKVGEATLTKVVALYALQLSLRSLPILLQRG